MICQSCHQNPATVHLTEIVQKTKRETHLCEDCAQNKGVTYKTQFSVKNFLSGLSPSKGQEGEAQEQPEAASPEAGAAEGLPQPAEAAQANPQPGKPKPKPKPKPEEPVFEPCASCGISFTDFRQNGRLGCSGCYEHFAAGLMPLLEKIHSARQHTGRVPQRIGRRLEVQRLTREHRERLQVAITEENYELAAELRDAIQALETQAESPSPSVDSAGGGAA